jgi:L-amino acid N-acyltransferase YncA
MTPRDHVRSAALRLVRTLLALRRASAVANAARLRTRGEDAATLAVRDAVESDIPALAELHVRTWNDTYAPLMKGPPVAVREAQWREAFARPDRDWFCLVVERPTGGLVAFARGNFRKQPTAAGELSKLYVAREYQGLGLGRRLLCRVADRFLDAGVTAMGAYVDPRNPSCNFFERFGGRWLVEDGGINFNWYVWSDLHALAGRGQ